MWEKIKVLEHHSHLLTVFVDIYLCICNVHTFKINMTSGRHLQKVQGTEECRFSGS